MIGNLTEYVVHEITTGWIVDEPLWKKEDSHSIRVFEQTEVTDEVVAVSTKEALVVRLSTFQSREQGLGLEETDAHWHMLQELQE